MASSLCQAQLASNAAWPALLGTPTNTGGYAGLGSNGSLRWTFPSTLGVGFLGSPIVGSNNVVYATDTQGYLYAINGASGAKIWSFIMNASCETAPALGSNGLVYTCDEGGTLHAISAATGNQIWSYQVPSQAKIESSPMIGSDGTIYFGCDDGNIYAISPTTHAPRWTFATLGTHLDGTAAITASGTLYYGADDDKLYALDTTTGGEYWSFTADSQIYCSPVVGSDGSIYFETYGGYIYSINSSGSQQWRYAATEIAYGSIAINNDEIYYGDSNGNLNAIPTTGVSPAQWTYSSGYSIRETPIVEANGDIVDCNVHGDVFEVSPSGALIWTYSTPTTFSEPTQLALGYDGTIYFGTAAQKLYALDGVRLSTAYANPNSVVGGSSATGVVQINEPAGPNGDVVTLTNYGANLGIPATVTIPAGKTGASFTITTTPVSAVSNEGFQASSANSNAPAYTVNVQVEPAAVSNFYTSPSSVVGGNASYGVVQLNGKAGSGGDVVSITGGGSIASPPATVTVAAGSSGVSFEIPTTAQSSTVTITLTATLGSSSMQTSLEVETAPISNFYATPSTLTGGTSTSGVVQLGGKAGPQGDTVGLESNSSSAVVPSTVTVAAGSTGKSFTITTSPVSASITVTLTASYLVSKQITLTLKPYPISNFYANPSTLVGGQVTHGVVQLAGKAGPSGDVVTLSSNNADLKVPATVTVPAGGTGVSFEMTTKAVSTSTSVKVTATLGSSSQQITITLSP